MGISSAGDDVPTALNLDLVHLIPAGEIHAFYVTTVNGGTISYTNGSTTGALFVSDANMEFYEGAGGGYFDVTFAPRVFNGNIRYTMEGMVPEISFDCSNLGENSVDVTVADAGGNEVVCTATVMVADETAPVLVCEDTDIELGADGTATIDPYDLLVSWDEACGIDVIVADLTDVDCSDIGTTVLVSIFANDASGNFASCQSNVTIVDAMEPTLTCPDAATYGTEPSNNNGVFVVRDYYGIGAATYSDNCTANPDLVVTQDPAPGTEWGINGSGNPGPYVVTFTVTDESGNVATCTLEVIVTNGIGIEDDTLLYEALNMYPNPATNFVKLVNTSNIILDSVRIYDLNGKLITELDLSDMEGETTFDVSQYATGVYMVRITGGDASVVKRLIKE